MDEYNRYAKLPLIPLVVAPDDTAMQDSTPIIERMEAAHPEPSIHPPDPAATFVSALIEEYADEWGNKPMFHFRWFYEADQESGAERIAAAMNPDATAEMAAGIRAAVKGRMVPRLAFVGSSPATKDQIEASFLRQLDSPKTPAARPFVFGGRPPRGSAFRATLRAVHRPTPATAARLRGARLISACWRPRRGRLRPEFSRRR
jgi:glutathione S-transferase